VDGTVAIGAACREGEGIVYRTRGRNRVTRDARSRLAGFEQVVCARAVWRVAEPAIFGNGCMLVDPGSHHFLMATRTQIGARAEHLPAALVRPVATGAVEHALRDGVVRRQVELGHHLAVATGTQARDIARPGQRGCLHRIHAPQQPQLTIVRIVAAAADKTRPCVLRVLPAGRNVTSGTVAGDAISITWVTDVLRLRRICVSLPRAVTRLAASVLIAGDMVLLERIMAFHTFGSTHRVAR
jgi:hypothetical protein